MDEDLSGVVVDSGTERTARITAMLSSAKALFCRLSQQNITTIFIQRLMTEKTISIDTTASGGNTSLMTVRR